VLKRSVAFLFALLAHLMLLVLICYLFPFLMAGPQPESSSDPDWWWIDLLLIVQFVVPHSLLLHPTVRHRLEKSVVFGPLYGCFFTLVTSVSLLALIFFWRGSPVLIYRLEGWAGLAMNTAYVLSWGALLYTLGLTGYGFQTGWAPFWGWFSEGRPPRRQFEVPGAYRWLRHPVYFAFLGQVWLTSQMTLDRLLLSSLFTVYIFLGSYLKDRRLEYYLGDTYREYSARVPGYPFFPGPLGKTRLTARMTNDQ
jgi:protein-S-isoprenylcysteine O-methyltransferase Ste14